MIARTAAARRRPAWQAILAAAVTDPARLLARLDLDPALLPAARAAAARFPLRVPEPWLARIRPGDPRDPLLLQVLPLGAERAPQPPRFRRDPLGERDALAARGLVRKYRSRALLVATGACAIHCRYCFRRHFPYGEGACGSRWEEALAWLARHPEVDEVILSGGDPLALPDATLAALADALEAVPHLRRLRIHTRLPVAIPARVDEGLAAWLGGLRRLQAVVVVHVNHAREIDGEVAGALARLRALGVTLLNQSVLLRGVNDDAATLAALSERLFEAGVLPYYLHLLDPVEGAAHFEVPEDEARALHAALAAALPGYLVPRLAREEPGAPAKTLLGA